MVPVAIAWLLGACALLMLRELPSARAVALLVGACLLLAAATRCRPALAFALGLTLAWWQCTGRLEARLDPALEGSVLRIEGHVASVPQASGGGLRFRFAPVARSDVPPLVEVTWYEPQWRPLAAERLELEVKLRRPRGFANPGGADYEARALRSGIGATGYVRAATRRGRSGGDIMHFPVLVARDAIHRAISSTLGTRPATGIVAGLAVGLQDALTAEQWRALARSGTSHLMAISGLHVGMFAIVAGGLVSRLQRWRQRRSAQGSARDAGVIVGSFAALAYAALAGGNVPAQRTVIMIAIVAAALIGRRRVAPADVLSAGAIAVLALEPLAPLAPGFWLSFGAVGAILLVACGQLTRPSNVMSYAQSQWAVTAGLVPVLVASFGSVSLVSVAVNFVAIPLYTLLVVPAVLIATALALVSPSAGSIGLHAVAWVIETTWPLIAMPASWEWATWPVAGLSSVAWVWLVCGAIAALSPLPPPGRLAGLLLACAACGWRPASPEHGAAHFAMLDVGQGLAAVIETRHHVLVYDAGPSFRSGGDAGAIAVEPYLRHRGRRGIDMLVASHDDLDHVGGAVTLASRIPVGRRVGSGHALETLGPAERCTRGEQWQWDGVRFEWLHPGADPPPGDNEASCVLLVSVGNSRILLTGDIEREAEAQILGQGNPGPIDVLVVAHHGSRTSSSQAFVAATHPRWALVSAGHRNRWGFPREDVVARWEESGAKVLNSAGSGAIEFELHPARPLAAPRLARHERRRVWHDP
jgi:competence protein ComEC